MRFWEFVKNVLLEEQSIQGISNSEEIGQNKNTQEANNQKSETESEQNENNKEESNQGSEIDSEQRESSQEANNQGSETESEQNESSQESSNQESKTELEQRESSQESSNQESKTESEQRESSQEASNQESKTDSEQSESSQEASNQGSETELEQNESSQESNNQESKTDSEQNENNKEESNLDKSSDNENANVPKSNRIKLEKEKLQNLKDKALEYDEKKKRREEKQKHNLEKGHLNNKNKDVPESEEEKNELSDYTNNFLKQLGELPSFKDRKTGNGYSIDTEGYTELPDSLIRTLITKFLNQRFCKHNTDLNRRSNSLEKDKGFYKWEVKDVITHLKTNQVTKVFDDKYGYKYADGKNEDVPLSFYFDMSGSMSEYTNMLAVIAIELLKKNVKVLIGFNSDLNVQIDSIDKNISVEDLAPILESAGYLSNRGRFVKDSRVKYKFISQDLADYLISSKAEKCVVFSDFDPLNSVCRLSNNCNVYWFCFERNFDKEDLNFFNGFVYKVQNSYDIANGLIKVNQNKFKSLCYTDNLKSVQKKIGGIK